MQSYKTSQVGGRASQVGGIACIFKVNKRSLEPMKLLIQMLPIQMMKRPLRSLCQKTPTTKPILIHKIGLDMMKKILRTRSEINIWLAYTKAKMLQKELLQDTMIQKELLQDIYSHLSVMHSSQKFQWVLSLQACSKIQNAIPY